LYQAFYRKIHPAGIMSSADAGLITGGLISKISSDDFLPSLPMVWRKSTATKMQLNGGK
jgi:hypothetical protein